MQKKQLLIIIPARCQSKSLKNKNIRKLGKHPLVSYSIEAAKKINEKEKIIHLSTDSKKYFDISKKYYDFNYDLRPKNLSKDHSMDIDFLNYTLNFYFKKNFLFKYCIILRPTNPLRKISTLNNSYKLFRKYNFDSLKTIFKTKKTPYKMWFKRGRLIESVIKNKKIEKFNFPRQKLKEAYNQTGTIEILKINFKNKLKNFSGKKIMGLEISEAESVDIDNITDLKISMKKLKNNNFIMPKFYKKPYNNKIFRKIPAELSQCS
jgi:CMP-N,N'-diacetyllegionaminic acid synthase